MYSGAWFRRYAGRVFAACALAACLGLCACGSQTGDAASSTTSTSTSSAANLGDPLDRTNMLYSKQGIYFSRDGNYYDITALEDQSWMQIADEAEYLEEGQDPSIIELNIYAFEADEGSEAVPLLTFAEGDEFASTAFGDRYVLKPIVSMTTEPSETEGKVSLRAETTGAADWIALSTTDGEDGYSVVDMDEVPAGEYILMVRSGNLFSGNPAFYLVVA